MNEFLDPSGNQQTPEENDIDRALRPISFDDFDEVEYLNENLFFHFFNEIFVNSGSLLITTSKPPNEINFSLSDLESRINSCISAKIELPDDDFLFSILIKELSDKKIFLNDKHCLYIIKRIKRNYNIRNTHIHTYQINADIFVVNIREVRNFRYSFVYFCLSHVSCIHFNANENSNQNHNNANACNLFFAHHSPLKFLPQKFGLSLQGHIYGFGGPTTKHSGGGSRSPECFVRQGCQFNPITSKTGKHLSYVPNDELTKYGFRLNRIQSIVTGKQSIRLPVDTYAFPVTEFFALKPNLRTGLTFR